MKKILLLLLITFSVSVSAQVVISVDIKYQGKDTLIVGEQNYIAITYDVVYGGPTADLYFEIMNSDLSRYNMNISWNKFQLLKKQRDGTTWLYYTTPDMAGNNFVRWESLQPQCRYL